MEKSAETTKVKHNVSISIPAVEKCRAVLSVWTERRKPAAVCRELGIKWTILMHWQNRALEGMLQALESRRNLSQGAALSPRLQALIAHREKSLLSRSSTASQDRLESRLANITAAKTEKKEQKTAEHVNNQPKE
jgi:hypothetical protein